ncbi:MAG: energy transducer TonB [Vulcanimicrobiaceae bacterium]
MKAAARLGAAVAAFGFAFAALPAAAQYANEFTPAKMIKQGTTSQSIAGSGQVKVQVQVNADGSHKVIKVDSSTNPGDNSAALEIAQTSSYRPAHRGSTPVPSFYTFVFKFSGKSLVAQEDDSSGGGGGSSSGSSGSSQIEAAIRGGHYAQAKSEAQSALLSNPSDDYVRQLLGVADYYAGDFTGSAQAFDKTSAVSKQFSQVAAQSFASAAVSVSDENPAQSLAYAQKAVALDPSTNSKFALGVAQVANKNYTDAISTLKSVHTAVFNDPKGTKAVKMGIDARLLEAYIANGDDQDAQAIATEMKGIDPTSNAAARVLGNHYLQIGSAAQQAKNYPDALKAYDSAIAQGDSQVSVTANAQAAFTIASMEKPDYTRMKGYADKAVALDPNNPLSNFAEGIALTGLWAGGSDAKMKAQAQDSLTKADTLAKAAGNETLALQIETFMKQYFK